MPTQRKLSLFLLSIAWSDASFRSGLQSFHELFHSVEGKLEVFGGFLPASSAPLESP